MKKLMTYVATAANGTGECPTEKSNAPIIDEIVIPEQTLRYLDVVKVQGLCEGLQMADAEDRRGDALYRIVKALFGYRDDGRASMATYLHVVIDSSVKDSWRAMRRLKRTHEMLTLDMPVPERNGYDGDGRMVDFVSDEDDGGFARADMKMDVESILARLTPIQARVCGFLMAGIRKSAIPALVGISEYEFKHKILPALAKAFAEFRTV